MQEYVNSLKAVSKAQFPEDREKAIAKVFKAIMKLTSAPAVAAGESIELQPLTRESSDAELQTMADEHGFDGWSNIIPVYAPAVIPKTRTIKEHLIDLAQLTYLKSCVRFETESELLSRIQHAKSEAELDELEFGIVTLSKKRFRLMMGQRHLTLSERIKGATDADKNRIKGELEKKRNYLKKKNTADTVATVLTAIVSSVGIGLTAGIAMVLVLPLIWPALSLAILIPALIGFTLFGSFTEFFVYRSHVKTFCRQFVRGFFQSIDDRILNREAKRIKENKSADKYDLSDDEKTKVLNSSWKIFFERAVKKSLTIFSIFLALGSGIGFTGFVFSQVASMLALFGVGGVALVAAPWALAILVGPLYAMVMYGMLYKAVKNNILGKIWGHIYKAFACKGFAELPWYKQLAHLGICFLKAAGVAAVLAVSILATIFTAGAWLDSSIAFFGKALSVVETTAEWIGIAVGLIFLAINLCFSIEKSLLTVSSIKEFISKTSKGEVSNPFKDMFYSPKTFFSAVGKGFVNLIFYMMHIIGSAAVAMLVRKHSN